FHTPFLLVYPFSRYGDHRDLRSFPTRRSSDLPGGYWWGNKTTLGIDGQSEVELGLSYWKHNQTIGSRGVPNAFETWNYYEHFAPDRKSTRLNSSHVKISYAVFCLKKKKKHNKT